MGEINKIYFDGEPLNALAFSNYQKIIDGDYDGATVIKDGIPIAHIDDIDPGDPFNPLHMPGPLATAKETIENLMEFRQKYINMVEAIDSKINKYK